MGFIIIPCKNVRFEVGYSATYWNSVVRPGNQVSRNVTSTQVPTDIGFIGTGSNNSPTFGFKSQGITIQSLNVGLTFYY